MRYFFNYRDAGRYFVDGEGSDHPDIAAATAEGHQSARELLGSEYGECHPEYLGGAYEITDDAGSVLAVVQFDDAGPAAFAIG
jgi:hypothetical protein